MTKRVRVTMVALPIVLIAPALLVNRPQPSHPWAWAGLLAIALAGAIGISAGVAVAFGAAVPSLSPAWGRLRAIPICLGVKKFPTRGLNARDGRRTLAVVAAVSLLIAVFQWIWIWQHRPFGTLDGDELRYVAGALGFRDLLLTGDQGQIGRWYGPVLPAISAFTMVFGPLDPRMAISIQPIFAGLTAVASAGVARRVASETTALLVGIAVALLPATLASSQVYLLGLPSAAALAGALWALFASDRGRGRTIWAVGPLLALAPLSRGMTLALMPAAYVAVLLYASATRVGLRRAIVSLSIGAFALASYLLIVGWAMVDYLLGGLNVPEVQAPSVLERVQVRYAEVADGMGRPLLAVGLVLAAASVVVLWRQGYRLRPLRGRPSVVIAVVLVFGWLPMLRGGDFGGLGFWDYPLIPILVVAMAALIGQLPRPVHVAASALALVWLIYLAGVSVDLVPPAAPGTQFGLGRYHQPLMESNNGLDPRLSQIDRRPEARGAAAEWWAADQEIDRTLRKVDADRPGPMEVVYLGGVNHSRYASTLIAQLQRRPALDYPFVRDGSNWAEVLEPSVPGIDRVLLIPHVDDPVTPHDGPRRRADSVYQESDQLFLAATDAGWTVAAEVPIPLGDRMLVVQAPEGKH